MGYGRNIGISEKCAYCGNYHNTSLALCPKCEKEAQEYSKRQNIINPKGVGKLHNYKLKRVGEQ